MDGLVSSAVLGPSREVGVCSGQTATGGERRHGDALETPREATAGHGRVPLLEPRCPARRQDRPALAQSIKYKASPSQSRRTSHGMRGCIPSGPQALEAPRQSAPPDSPPRATSKALGRRVASAASRLHQAGILTLKSRLEQGWAGEAARAQRGSSAFLEWAAAIRRCRARLSFLPLPLHHRERVELKIVPHKPSPRNFTRTLF